MARYTEEEVNDRFVEEETGLTPQKINFVVEYAKDFNVTRASTASNVSAKVGKSWLDKDVMVQAAIDNILQQRMESVKIDAEWVLNELVDNHHIARYQGDIKASTAALTIIAKQASVDSMAADKVKVDPITITVDRAFAEV